MHQYIFLNTEHHADPSVTVIDMRCNALKIHTAYVILRQRHNDTATITQLSIPSQSTRSGQHHSPHSRTNLKIFQNLGLPQDILNPGLIRLNPNTTSVRFSCLDEFKTNIPYSRVRTYEYEAGRLYQGFGTGRLALIPG